MDTAVVLFTRDLRVRDNPALAEAARSAERVVPLFVLDDGILGAPFGRSPNRLGFLAESLADLDASLRELGSRLILRRGDPGDAIASLQPDVVHLAEDASAHAQRRERALAERFDLQLAPSTTVIPFDELKTYKVFTPYHRAWSGAPRRALDEPPQLADPEVESEPLPGPPPGRSPRVAHGGERAGRAALERWLPQVARYDGNDLAGDTSRLSPYLHFGCVSPLECALRGHEGAAWVRQLCWRDFYAQLLRAYPHTSRTDLYDRPYARGAAGPAFDAWCAGRTGYPLVDAGMRQLASEGWMHNRARLVTASFLVKDIGVDWRHGADHFEHLLVDGDVASNRGNWQWVAGSGVDHAQGGRMFNPTLQAQRFDPRGDYIRRHVPELALLDGARAHEPWKHGGADGYPAPILDHAEIASRRRRGERPTLF